MATITGIKAGTTTITASYGGKTATVQITVQPIDPSLTFSVNSTALTYNGAAQLLGTVSYNGDGQAKYYVSTSNSAPGASASGWVNCSNGTQVKATNAGTYYVFLQATAGTNYNAVAVKAGNTTGKAIAQKAVTYKADNQSWVYDGSSHSASNTATKTAGDLVSGHTATFSCSGSVGPNVTSSSGTKTLSSVTIRDASNNTVTSNYAITKQNGTLNITARPITVTASSASRAYNGSPLTSNSATAEVTGTNRGLVSGHSMTSCTVTGTITNVGSVDNVASAAVIKSGSTDVTSNYSITYVKGTLTITQRTVTIYAPEFNSDTLTYNGEEQLILLEGTATTGGTMYSYVSTSNSTPTFSTSTWSTGPVFKTDAGTYYAWYYCYVSDTTNNTGSGINTVTKISSPASKAINQKAVTVTAPSGSKVYDGTALTKSSGATISGQVSGHTLNSVSYGGTITNVGSADCTVSNATIYSGSTNVTSNYSITYAKGTLTVSARPIKVTASSASRAYNGSALTSNSATAEATGTNRGLVSGHSMTSCTVTGSQTVVGSSDNIASGAVIKDGSSNTVTSNYSITYVKGTLTITQRSVSITAPSYNSSTLTYNGSAQTVASGGSCGTGGTMYYYISTTNSTPTFSTTTWSTSATVQATNAGTYYVWYYCRVTDTTNNTGSGINTVTKISSPASKAINQKAVTITGSSASKVYDGTALTKSTGATISGQVSGHTLASCTLTGSQTVKGSSNNVPSAATINDGNGNNVTSNYSITYANGTLTVSARPINVTASSASRAYNGSALTSNSATAEATGTNRGLVSGHSMTSCTVSGTITNVGSVDNVASGATIKSGSTDVTSNYSITYVKGTLTITQRNVSITAPTYNSSTLTYSGSAQTVASGGTCGAGGTMYYYISTTNSTPTFSTASGSGWSTSSNVQATNAGTYYVWYYCQVTDTTNNTGSGINTVTKISSPASKAINQKAVTVTAASDSKTYDGTALTKNSASLSGQVSGHTLASYTVTGSQTLAGSSSNVPSAARINDGGGNNVTSNYSITYTNGTLTVNKCAVTYTADNQSWTYDGTTHSASNTATKTGGTLPSSHTATITCGGSITYVGTATKTISVVIKNGGGTDVSSSFTITATSGTLTVSKATPAITVTGVNQTYNNTTYYAKVTKSDAKGTLYWKYGSVPTTSSYGGTTDISSVGTPVGNPAALSTPINITSVKDVTNQTLYWIFVPSSSATITTGQTYAANFNNSASGSVTMKITAAAITIPTPTGYTGTYDAAAHTATFSAATGASITNYRYSTNNSTWTETNNTTNPSQTNYGTLYVQAYYTADANHSGSGWSSSATITVNRKPVTVTAGSASRAYNGSALTKADGTTASGLVSGHSLTSYTNTGSQTYVGSSNNVPSAAVIKDGSGNVVTTNYSITYANGTLTVSKANPSVTVTGITADYTGGSFYATAKANAIGTLYWKKGAVASASSCDGSVKLSTLNTNTNVTFVKDNADDFVMYWYFVPSSSDNITSGQTYAANFNNAGGGSSDKVNLTINPRDIANISVTATATTYNGSSQTATLSAITDSGGNVTSSDYTISGNTGTNAGNYTITFTGKNNYTGTKTISWTINKRAVTITAGSDSKTYDGTALTKNTVSASAQSGDTGMISSHHVHSWTVSGSQTLAGSSDNVVSAATIYNGTHSGTESDVSSNYTITFAKGTLTVNKAAITYTATNQTKVYDGSTLKAANTASRTAGITSLPSGHTVTFTCTGEIGPGVSSGTKTLSSVVIKNSGGTNVTSSFTVTKVNGTLSITAATITYTNTSPVSEYCTATATATNKTLGNVTISIGSASATDYAGNAITNSSDPSVEGYTISQSGWSISSDGKTITVPANVDAGTYNITVTAAKPNHTSKTNGISVTLTAVVLSTLTLTPHTNTIPYGGTTEVDQVKATYSNGKWKDVKDDATYTTNPTGIVTIS